MPTTLQHLTTNRKPLTVDLNGDAVNIEYYPMRVTGEMLVEYASLGRIQEMSDDQALDIITSPDVTLLTLLAGWDLMESIDDAGTPGTTPLAINAANIAALGIMLQWVFVHAIMQDAGDAGNAGKAIAPEASAKKPPSGAISSRTARSARSRTGIR